jgi:hypothetical protein
MVLGVQLLVMQQRHGRAGFEQAVPFRSADRQGPECLERSWNTCDARGQVDDAATDFEAAVSLRLSHWIALENMDSAYLRRNGGTMRVGPF